MLVMLVLGYANVIGIPEFLQKKIAVALREHGVPVEFSRMRWHFGHGIVAENVILGEKADRATKALLTAGEVQLRIDYGALLKRKFQLSGVVLRERHPDPARHADQPPGISRRSGAKSVSCRTTPGRWTDLRLVFSGAKFTVSARVAHAAPEAMNWELFAGKKTGGHGKVANSLQDFADTLAKIKFSTPPQINAQITGDARDVRSFVARNSMPMPRRCRPRGSTRKNCRSPPPSPPRPTPWPCPEAALDFLDQCRALPVDVDDPGRATGFHQFFRPGAGMFRRMERTGPLGHKNFRKARRRRTGRRRRPRHREPKIILYQKCRVRPAPVEAIFAGQGRRVAG